MYDARSEMTSASSVFFEPDSDNKYGEGYVPFGIQTQKFCDSDEKPFDPAVPTYKRKEKTEICKNWLQGACRYGTQCAFAHGREEVQKKTHVAAKYKAGLCNSYHNTPFFCQYGTRCQFAHLTRDFAEDCGLPSYRNLLTENVNQMKIRLDNVAKPDIKTFNVALPNK